MQVRWWIDRRRYGRCDAARSLDVDRVPNQQACVDELRAVCDRADGKSSLGDVPLVDPQHARSRGKREVAVPDGELFERTAQARCEVGPASGDDELVRLESGREVRDEELGCRNRSA